MENTNQSARKLISLLRRMRKLRIGEMPLKGTDISFPQMALLRRVSLSPGCRLKDIAAELGLSAPTVSVGIHRLTEAGFLEARPDPQDKRATRIYLSEKGKALQKSVRTKRYEFTQKFLAGLSPEEQEQLLILLEKAIFSSEDKYVGDG
ncbi:MAG: MarR family transcriptional regulator [Chloroflexi bacterium]|nr:MarR family transcriptional regulator [Chloroflexota bacterium]